MASDNELDVIIRFLLDQSAKQRADEGIKDTAKKMDSVGDAFPVDQLNADFALFEKAFHKTFKRVGDDLIDTRTGAKATTAELQKFSRTSVEDLAKIAKATEEVKDNNRDMAKSAAESAEAQASIFSNQASLLNSQVQQMRARSSELQRYSNLIGGISRAGLVAGTAITAGIFGIANKYVNSVTEATEVTKAWKKAQEDLAESGNRIGAVFAEQALPTLEKAVTLAGKAATFIESHPELVQAALNVGIITAGISAIGLAVSKGIRFYADRLYLASVPVQMQAAQLQFAASEQQLAAATLRAEAKGLDVLTNSPTDSKTAPRGGFSLGSVVLTATSVIIGAELGLSLGNTIGRLITGGKTGLAGEGNFGLGDIATAGIMAGQTPSFLLAKGLNSLGVISDEAVKKYSATLTEIDRFTAELLGANKILNVINKLSPPKEGSQKPPLTGVEASEQFEQILKAYEDYKRDDLKLVQDHYKEREKIVSDSLKEEEDSMRRMNEGIARVRSQAGASIRQATQQFTQDSRNAEVEYASQRAQIIRDGGVEIQRIEQELQERLRKMALDHGERMDDLARSRDALGLVKEQRNYNRERSEEERAANIEIRQRRQDLAIRLQEAQQAFEQERAQRLAEFQTRIQEIRSNAASQIAELRAQNQAELREIREQRVARIRELDQQFTDERKRRTQQFLQQVRDLDASLLGEQNLKKSYQAKMIADLDRFLASYRSKLGALASARPPGKFEGGYASYGTYTLGDSSGGGRGKTEYVMSGATTEAAERLLGGQLSQGRLLSALSLSAGARNAFNYQDNRRIDGRLGPVERQGIVNDTVRVIERMLSDALPLGRGA